MKLFFGLATRLQTESVADEPQTEFSEFNERNLIFKKRETDDATARIKMQESQNGVHCSERHPLINFCISSARPRQILINYASVSRFLYSHLS